MSYYSSKWITYLGIKGLTAAKPTEIVHVPWDIPLEFTSLETDHYWWSCLVKIHKWTKQNKKPESDQASSCNYQLTGLYSTNKLQEEKRVYRFKKTRKQITNHTALFDPDSSNCKAHIRDIFEITRNSNDDWMTLISCYFLDLIMALFCLFDFWPHCVASKIVIYLTRDRPAPLALGVWNLNDWTNSITFLRVFIS